MLGVVQSFHSLTNDMISFSSSSSSFSSSSSSSSLLLFISTTHESDFATYHSTLIKKGALKQAQKGTSVSLSVRPLQGDLEQLRKDFALLINKNTVIVNKLGFPDVILPGGWGLLVQYISTFLVQNTCVCLGLVSLFVPLILLDLSIPTNHSCLHNHGLIYMMGIVCKDSCEGECLSGNMSLDNGELLCTFPHCVCVCLVLIIVLLLCIC